MYTVRDFVNNTIKGNFYPTELSVIKGDVFKVEKVIERATVEGVRKMFVKWEGYPDRLNSWILASDYGTYGAIRITKNFQSLYYQMRVQIFILTIQFFV